jgi:hypothetical protein
VRTLAGLGLLALGLALMVWRRLITRSVVNLLAFGYEKMAEDDPMLRSLSLLTAVAGALAAVLGARLLWNALSGG